MADAQPPQQPGAREFASTWLVEAVAHIREAGPLRLAVRGLVVLVLDMVAIWVLSALLPGLDSDSLWTAFVVAFVIGLLNALVRPLILAFAISLPIIAFAVVVLCLNGVMFWLAGRLVPGFTVTSLVTALIASFGLAAINTGLMAILHIEDDDRFHRNVVHRIQRRLAPLIDPDRTGAVIVQIDGLAEPVLRQALAEGRMPTLQRWLSEGTHRLTGWDCDVPSMTSSGQAGILWGNNANIPAFRWYDKELKRLLVSNNPVDAHIMNERQATNDGLLHLEGAGVGNIFTGGADHCILTMATLVDDNGKITAAPSDFVSFFASPYSLTRLLLEGLGEIAREYWEAWQQRRKNVLPRMHRGGKFPLQRFGTNVLLQDLTVWSMISNMQTGRLVIYGDLMGYDEVAHHAGPAYVDSLRALGKIDRELHRLERAAETAPRPYEFVVVSDHGQSWGATFLQRYGLTLEDLTRELLHSEQLVHQTKEPGEGAGYVSAALSQVASSSGAVGSAVRRGVGQTMPDEPVALGQDRQDKEAVQDADVVVCASGNLGLISFTNHPGRLTTEFIEAAHPGLLDGLRAHDGIGWLLVRSESQGSLVLGKDGVRNLDSDEVSGVDPLAAFPPTTVRYLKRLTSYPNVADIMLNSTLFNPETGEVAAFEELIGCHGGAGGWQTQPFLLYPSAWTDEEPKIFGSEQVHAFLRRFVGRPAKLDPLTDGSSGE